MSLSHLLRSMAFLGAMLAVNVRADDGPPPVEVRGEATDVSDFTLELVGGDRLHGQLLGVEEDTIRWAVGSGEEISIPRSALTRVGLGTEPSEWTPGDGDLGPLLVPPPPAPTPEPVVEPIVEPPPPVDESALAAPPPLLLLEPEVVLERAAAWTQRIEIGGQFVDGNSESDSLNVAGKFAQETERRKAELEFGGVLGSADGVFATNRWFGNVTMDFNRPKSARWLIFLTARNEYDQFENLDYRGTFSGGLGYRFVVQGEKLVLVRLGPGATMEFHRDPYRERYTPDLFAQLEVKWPLFDRLTYENTTTFNPSIDETFSQPLQDAFDVYRLTSRSGLVLPLDEDKSWNLKLGFRFDYDSKPNKNRLPTDYTTTLVVVYQRK